MTLDWFIGFSEGEGCFTFLSKFNNTTVGGKRVYYRRDQPQFCVAQSEFCVLEKMAQFLHQLGIYARVWKKQKTWMVRGKKSRGQAHELRVVGYENCRKLATLFAGRIESEYKRRQFERWLVRINSANNQLTARQRLIKPVPASPCSH